LSPRRSARRRAQSCGQSQLQLTTPRRRP
jgi:hypothetical protein